jgi:methylphosphotriester-DNA--protein-cysteine methyltransferase
VGTIGAHRRGRIYGRLDCASALRAIRRGGYVHDRVFFANESTAVAAGYRPCAVCMPREYASWKRKNYNSTSSDVDDEARGQRRVRPRVA